MPRMSALFGLSMVALLALPADSSSQTRQPANVAVAITQTAEGGYRQSPPQPRVHLVEYVSYTCGHCADYDREASSLLRSTYVGRGSTSVEVRPLVRDAVDLAAATMARCGAPNRFFARHHALMARQAAMLAAAQANAASWPSVPAPQRLARIARDVGVIDAVLPHGVTTAQANACLADQAAIRRTIAIGEASAALGIEGTPSFLINGTLQTGVHSWASLRPRLDAALTAR